MPVPDLSVIIPAYNEVGTIVGTLTAVRDHLSRRGGEFEVIVSADGSDGTREIARKWAGDDRRFIVIGSERRGGKGRGVRAGVEIARGQIIGFIDADYKTPIEEADRLLPWFDQGYDLVIGSRGMSDSRIEREQKLYRRVGSRVFAFAMRNITGLRDITDTQCGFKFFTRRAAREIFGRQRIDGYMFDVEILRLAETLGCRIKEIGIRWRDDGDSRLELIAGNWRNARDILKIGLSRFARPALSCLAPDAPPAQDAVARRTTLA